MISSAGLIGGITCIFSSLLLFFLLMAVHKTVARAGIILPVTNGIHGVMLELE
jgi:hypothetical protein